MGLRNRYQYHDKQIFFITTTCHNWLHLLEVGKSKNITIESLIFCLKKYKSAMLGYVIMPNHIHFISHFPNGADRVNFIRDFKKFTSTKIRKEVEAYQPDLLDKIRYIEKKQVFKIWQDRFDEVYLEDRKLLEIKLDYIHNNPLQSHWTLADSPENYEYSSALFYEKEKQRTLNVTHYLEFL